jgi:hypothetical protein
MAFVSGSTSATLSNGIVSAFSSEDAIAGTNITDKISKEINAWALPRRKSSELGIK